MKQNDNMKEMQEQLAALHKRIEYMEKEMFEIRKGNTLGVY